MAAEATAGMVGTDLRGRRVLITGAGGYLGRHAVVALAAAGARVSTLAMRGARERDLLRRADARAVWSEALGGVDLVLHLAANTNLAAAEVDPDFDFTSNVASVRDLLHVCRTGGLRPDIVLASSIRASAPASEGVYELHKRIAEALVLHHAENGFGRSTALRFSSLYGPARRGGQARGVLNAMMAAAIRGEPLALWGHGRARRDHLYVEDAAAALAAAAAAMDRCSGRAFDVGANRSVALADACRLIAAQAAARTGTTIDIREAEAGSALPGDGFDVVADISAFRTATGWRPVRHLEDGVAQTLDHLASTCPMALP